ncbi:MAG: TatD family hydrolase [Spirochaetaceae bacterium]|jgi:TatD DNase family protein|nr:TatD family hydrolase [Spirochaetaceae bacterium]
MIFCDAHIHIAQIPDWEPVAGSPVLTCAHSPAEYRATLACAGRGPVFRSFGIHPQEDTHLPGVLAERAAFLENLLREGKLDAVGEAGFDLWPEYAGNIARQEEAWHIQLDLAARYGKPLVVHCRKALHLIFRDAALLKRLPAAVFHSFPGSPEEARALLRRGVGAFFSLGKPLLNHQKRAARSALDLPLAHLLAETDAPWQTLRGETITGPADIVRVYQGLAAIRGVPVQGICAALEENFYALLGRKPGIL